MFIFVIDIVAVAVIVIIPVIVTIIGTVIVNVIVCIIVTVIVTVIVCIGHKYPMVSILDDVAHTLVHQLSIITTLKKTK